MVLLDPVCVCSCCVYLVIDTTESCGVYHNFLTWRGSVQIEDLTRTSFVLALDIVVCC